MVCNGQTKDERGALSEVPCPKDDQIFKTRECSGIFCDEKTETETKDEPCLKVRNYF